MQKSGRLLPSGLPLGRYHIYISVKGFTRNEEVIIISCVIYLRFFHSERRVRTFLSMAFIAETVKDNDKLILTLLSVKYILVSVYDISCNHVLKRFNSKIWGLDVR